MISQENFRSFHIILGDASKENLDGKLIYDLVKWLNRFDQWYRNETGISQGNNLHLLRDRELFISANNLLGNISAIDDLLSLCLQLGFVINIRVSLNECYEFLSNLDLLTDNFCPIHLIIESGDIHSKNYPSSFVIPLIEKLALKKIHLSFCGSISFWLETGICHSQVLGENVYDIIPETQPFRRYFWGDYNPCSKRFMFVINSDGLIYPCMGLIGIDMCSIGTVEQPLSSLWESVKHHSLNLEQLASCGPELNTLNMNSKLLEFQNICEAHRYSLLH